VIEDREVDDDHIHDNTEPKKHVPHDLGGQRAARSRSMPSVTSSPPPNRSPSRATERRPACAARTAMAALSTEAPTPPDPPTTTPTMDAVFMGPESPQTPVCRQWPPQTRGRWDEPSRSCANTNIAEN